jgi:hypothetical protein
MSAHERNWAQRVESAVWLSDSHTPMDSVPSTPTHK